MLDLDIGHERGLRWDLRAAMRAINFFPDVLRLAQKFEGEPFALQPVQQFIIGSLFGWKGGADGARRFRRVYIEMGKGNGKSPLAAGIGMYALLADGEPQAEVYAGASMKSQAMVIFRSAVQMWRQSPALAKRLTPSGGNPVWNLADLRTGSFFRPISTDEAHSGPMPSCALLDEIHEHRDGHMIEMMERGFKSRRQPLLIMITNSGTDRESACWQEHQHAVRVAAGTMVPDDDATFVGEAIDDTSFSFVCAVDKDDDPLEDETCWPKANPLLSVSMPADELRRAVSQAKAIPGKLNGIMRLHFCQWTDADETWISTKALDAVLADFDPSEHFGKPVFMAADLSATRDMTALAFLVPTGTVTVEREDGTSEQPTFDAWVEVWTPRDTLAARALEDNAPYELWARDGWLIPTPGPLVRYDFVAARVAEAAGEYQVEAIAYDAYAFQKHFEPELDQFGVTAPLVEHPQGGKRRAPASGLWMPGSVKIIEQLILEKRIRLRRSPVLRLAMLSTILEADPFDNRWLSKRKSVNRIDAAVALTMVAGMATAIEPEPEYQMLFLGAA